MAQDSQASKRYYEEEDDDDEYDFEEFKRRQKKKRRQKSKGKETQRNRQSNNNNDNGYSRNNGYYDRINEWRGNRHQTDDDEGEGRDSNDGLRQEHKPKGEIKVQGDTSPRFLYYVPK